MRYGVDGVALSLWWAAIFAKKINPLGRKGLVDILYSQFIVFNWTGLPFTKCTIAHLKN